MVKVKSYEDNSMETEGKRTIYLLYVSVAQLLHKQSLFRSSRQIE